MNLFTALEAAVVVVPTSYETIQYTQPYPGFSGGTNYFPGYLETGSRVLTSQVISHNVYTLDLTGFNSTNTTINSVAYTWSNAVIIGNVGTYFLTATEQNDISNSLGSGQFTTGMPNASVSFTGNTNLTLLVQDSLGTILTLYGYSPIGGRAENGGAQFTIDTSAVPEPSTYLLLGVSCVSLLLAFRQQIKKSGI